MKDGRMVLIRFILILLMLVLPAATQMAAAAVKPIWEVGAGGGFPVLPGCRGSV